MDIEIKSSGSFSNLERFLTKASTMDVSSLLRNYAQAGVNALEGATPVDSGLAGRSWGYEINKISGGYEVVWTNSDVENGFPVAKMIQIGYATGTGGYVAGRDYINPAMRPIFDQIANQIWKAVTSA